MPYAEAALHYADEVRANELLDLAQIIQAAVAAGMAQMTPVPHKGGTAMKRQVGKVLDNYQKLLRGLHARATGQVGEQYDAQGRPIIRTMAQLRNYLEKFWNV